MNTSKSFTKNSLVSELAGTSGLSKAAVARVLDQLAQLAYREAMNGFVIPGICKIKVVQRKASRHRNPITGKLLLIGERQAVKVVVLKKAKNTIAPNKDVVVQVIDDLTPLEMSSAPPVEAGAAQPAAPAAAASSPGAPSAAPAFHENEEGQIVFPCAECGSMIAAPPKTAGKKGECPFCKAVLRIPQRQAEAKTEAQVLPTKAKEPITDFVSFVCKACGQEIEAPIDMVGMSVDCPTCATSLTVPLANAPKPPPSKTPPTKGSKPDSASMTIRIDLSDLQ
jgi:DNA-binding protein HU-beta